jgi:hypothetical protein
MNQLKLSRPQDARLHNIIDMGLNFSAMIRLFEKKSKEKLRARILGEVQNVFGATSKEQFQDIHSSFCNWGINNIMLAERRKNGQVIKRAAPASYGQIAKTFDVLLKVAVYYCHLPDSERSELISKWLNAAVDTKMMAMLKKCYPLDVRPWPAAIEQVNKSIYAAIQETVRKFIQDKHSGCIIPVQFDDIYWEALNRQMTAQ